MTLRDAVHATVLTLALGWLLVVGKTVILPVVVAIMLTYVLVGAVQGVLALPLGRRLPAWLAYVAVLTVFALGLTGISLMIVANLRDIARSELAVQDGLLALIERFAPWFGYGPSTDPDVLRGALLERLDLPGLSLDLLSTLASASGYTVLIATYMVFMVAERAPLGRKIDLVLPDTGNRGAAVAIFQRINRQIVTYLSTKTLINVIVALISWVLMKIMGIENAAFWAFLIGLFNYIPYVGSMMGVGVVLVFVILTTGSLRLTVVSLLLLTAAQVYVGNWLEPRVMSRSMNLSPLTVLLALVLWGSLWGLPGAIIAVPMTSILLIALAQFRTTRAVAVLASRNGTLY